MNARGWVYLAGIVLLVIFTGGVPTILLILLGIIYFIALSAMWRARKK